MPIHDPSEEQKILLICWNHTLIVLLVYNATIEKYTGYKTA